MSIFVCSNTPPFSFSSSSPRSSKMFSVVSLSRVVILVLIFYFPCFKVFLFQKKKIYIRILVSEPIEQIYSPFRFYRVTSVLLLNYRPMGLLASKNFLKILDFVSQFLVVTILLHLKLCYFFLDF